MTTNVAGGGLSPEQELLVECFDRITALLAEAGDRLAPFERSNAKKAQASLWQIVNGLDMDRKLV